MYSPTYEEIERLAADTSIRVVPVSRELYADGFTPIGVLRILKNVSSHCYLLESVEDSEKWGRYTFLGYDPRLCLTCKNGRLTIQSHTSITEAVSHPAEAIRHILMENKSPRFKNLPPFTGGLVGYFSFDYIQYSEPTLQLDAEDTEAFQDVDLMLFDKVIAFDNLRQKIILIANMRLADGEVGYNRAMLELEQMAALLKSGKPAPSLPTRLLTPFTPRFSRDAYCAMVEKAKGFIREGDIFQVVLANRMEAGFSGSLLDAYRVLRTLNPSPYMFYFSSDDIEIAGASPETLVKLADGVLHTFPLAGTRPRGKTEKEDRELEKDLLQDEKELAEHNMLVDLGRNDIGRISDIGTVQVEKYLSVERFSHVMHLGSTVSGRIREDRDALDAVDAILPAGTLSGAPKLRACQIINDLENTKRGIYGGAIGYIDFTGNLDTCIAIRLAYAKNGKVFVCSGAGIVADSVPENEYVECLNKAGAVMTAIQTAQEGVDL